MKNTEVYFDTLSWVPRVRVPPETCIKNDITANKKRNMSVRARHAEVAARALSNANSGHTLPHMSDL